MPDQILPALPRHSAHADHRALLGWTVLVLALHLWALAGLPQRVDARAAPVHTMHTRLIAPSPVVPSDPAPAPTAPPAGDVPAPVALATPLRDDATGQHAPQGHPAPPGAAAHTWSGATAALRERAPAPMEPATMEPAPIEVTEAPPATPNATAATDDAHPQPRTPRRRAAAGPSPPVRPPPAAQLRYHVTRQGPDGDGAVTEARLSWQPEGSQYLVQWALTLPSGRTRTQSSRGTLDAAGLHPVRYADQPASEQAAHFDAEGARVRFSSNAPDAALASGAQDRLSVLLQLGALIGAAPARYPPGSQITVQTVGTRDAPLAVFVVVGDEAIRTAAGTLEQAVRLERAPTGAWEPRLEVWLGRSLDYLPLRLRSSGADGQVTDQLLSEAVVAGRAAPVSEDAGP